MIRTPRRAIAAHLVRGALGTLAIAIAPGCQGERLVAPSTSSHPAPAGPPLRQDLGGWIVLHLSGSPDQIGFQHGSTLGPEIDDAIRSVKLAIDNDHDLGYDWAFYRDAVQRFMLTRIDGECMEELNGLARGVRSRGFDYDAIDLIAFNAYLELTGYYAPAVKARQTPPTPPTGSPGAGAAPVSGAPERCSAFIATGSQTADGRIVMGHNMWDGYLTGERINVIVDITPRHGHRIVMDTMPGMIHSGTDFVINDAGIVYTETTISDFMGFDEHATPEFVRARRAAQYAESLDDFYHIMCTGNNGGYANTWLVGDISTGEIGKLELGLRNVVFHRTSDGYYVGANYPEDPKLAAEECPDYDPKEDDCEVRHERWARVMADNKGKVDAGLGMAFLGDTVNARTGASGASGSTLCGRSDQDPQRNFSCGGATNAKVTTADMARNLTLWARMGFPDGSAFDAKEYLNGRGQRNNWMRPMLRDIPAKPWVVVGASVQQPAHN
jgi:hypothetical protein